MRKNQTLQRGISVLYKDYNQCTLVLFLHLSPTVQTEMEAVNTDATSTDSSNGCSLIYENSPLASHNHSEDSTVLPPDTKWSLYHGFK